MGEEKSLWTNPYFLIICVVLILFIVFMSVLVIREKDLNTLNTQEQLMDEDDEKVNRIATFDTSLGSFKVELFEDKMPETTKNFITLAESEFYDETRFHRVIKDFMVQGGDPLSKDPEKKGLWGTGGSDPIDDEFSDELSNIKGTIAMANSGPNTGSSQFFINVVDNTYLDFNKPPQTSKHPVFGKVIDGMDIVEDIANVEVDANSRPVEDVMLLSVNIGYK